ncbi:MAG: hypothetical protein AB7O97_03265 [Planctomycetota bacterium]
MKERPRSALALAAGCALAILGGCGEGRATRVQRAQPQFQQDVRTVLQAWDAGAIDALVQHVDRRGIFADRAATAQGLTALRRDLGPVAQRADVLIDPAPDDERAYAIGHQVMATENGVARLSIVYDRDLQIVGFWMQGQAAPAMPR